MLSPDELPKEGKDEVQDGPNNESMSETNKTVQKLQDRINRLEQTVEELKTEKANNKEVQEIIQKMREEIKSLNKKQCCKGLKSLFCSCCCCCCSHHQDDKSATPARSLNQPTPGGPRKRGPPKQPELAPQLCLYSFKISATITNALALEIRKKFVPGIVINRRPFSIDNVISDDSAVSLILYKLSTKDHTLDKVCAVVQNMPGLKLFCAIRMGAMDQEMEIRRLEDHSTENKTPVPTFNFRIAVDGGPPSESGQLIKYQNALEQVASHVNAFLGPMLERTRSPPVLNTAHSGLGILRSEPKPRSNPTTNAKSTPSASSRGANNRSGAVKSRREQPIQYNEADRPEHSGSSVVADPEPGGAPGDGGTFAYKQD